MPQWLHTFLDSNVRERKRLREELGTMRGAIRVLALPRKRGAWNTQERAEVRKLLRAAYRVGPYLLVMALPGSFVVLPLLAWRLDAHRKRRQRLIADDTK